jgi:hypothetical protein
MSYLQSLNPQRPNQAAKPDTHLTLDTFPAIAQRLVKAGLNTNFSALVFGQAKAPEMMQTIKPVWVGKAAAGLAAEGNWGSFAQLVCAVKDQPLMMAKMKPADIKAAAAYMIAPDGIGNTKAFGLNGLNAYIDLLDAVSAYPKLVAVFAADDVAKVAKTVAQAMSHVYNSNPSYGRRFHGHADEFHTMYYPDKAEKFAMLAGLVKADAQLNVAIDPVDVAAAAMTLFQGAEEKVREHQTDQGYPVELPERFGGFKPLTRFAQDLADAPESWRVQLAAFVKNVVKNADNRSVPHIAAVVGKAPYLMSNPDFRQVIDEAEGDATRMAIITHAFANVGHLKPEYPAVIAQLMRAGFKSFESVVLREGSLPGHEAVVARTVGEMVASLADAGDYARMSRLASQLWDTNMVKAGCDSLATRELHVASFYSGWTGDKKTYDEDFAMVMGRRSFLDIVFRKAAGDAVVCVDNANEGSYRAGERLPRVVVEPVRNAGDVDAAPEGLAPAIRMAFHKVVAQADKTPGWVQDIARKVLASAPAP